MEVSIEIMSAIDDFIRINNSRPSVIILGTHTLSDIKAEGLYNFGRLIDECEDNAHFNGIRIIESKRKNEILIK